MNKILFALLLILLTASPAGALSAAVQAVCGANSATCTTSNDSELVSITDQAGNKYLSETTWASQQYTITSGTTITTWFLHSSNGSCTGNFTCSLYTAGADNKPGSEIAGSSVSTSCSGVSNDTDLYFNLSTPIVVNATSVHVVCRMASGGGTGYIRQSTSSVYEGGISNNSTDSGSSWANSGSNDMHISLYGCTP